MEKVSLTCQYKLKKKLKKNYEEIIEMSRNNDYTTGNLLDFPYFKGHYRLIAIGLSKQTRLNIHSKLVLLANLKTKLMVQQCYSSLKNQKKLLSNFYKIL